MTQEISVSAIDQHGGGADKADNRGAQSRCLPRLVANARLSVDGDGNFTIGRVVGVSVGGLHHQAEASALIWRHSGIAARGLCRQHVPESESGFEPIRQITVKWQNDCLLRVRIGFREDQILNFTAGAMRAVYPLRSADGISRIDR